MVTSYKTVKKVSLSVISLMALSISNNAYAACVGSPTLDCTGTTTTPLTIDAPITVLNIQAGADLTVGPASVDAVAISSDLTVNVDGTLDNTATAGGTGGLVGKNNTVDLTVNNNATGVVKINGGNRAVAVGSDSVSSARINTATLNNAGLVEATTDGRSYVFAGGNNADTITNTGILNGNYSLLGGDDVVTNDGTMNMGRIVFGTGNDTFTNNAAGIVNVDSNFGSNAARFNKSSGDLTVNNDGSITLTGTLSSADLIDGPTSGLLTVNNTGTLQNSGTGGGTKWVIISRGQSNITNSGSISSDGDRAISGLHTTMSDVITNTMTGVITGDIRFANSDDTITNDGTINGDVFLFGGDDIFSIDLDTGSVSGIVNGGRHTAGDTLNIDSDSGNATISGDTYFNFETINLSGDNELTTTEEFTADAVNLLGDTGLVISNGSSITASTLMGTTGNDITVDAGGTLTADTTLSGGDETFTINGDVDGDIDLGAGNDVLSINLNTGSYIGNADGGAHAASDMLDFTSGGTENLDLNRFINFEDLSFDGNGTFNTTNTSGGTFDSISLLNNTNLNLGSGGTLTSVGAFTNGGVNSITIGADATINADSFTPPSTLTFDVATDTSFGVLNITGGPVNLTGTNVTALVSDAVTDADEVEVATGVGALIGVGGGAGQTFVDIPDTSLLFNFGMADGSQGAVTSSVDPNSLFIVADKVFLIRQVIEQGNEANVGEVLEVLETIPPGINDPQIQAVLGKVNSASDADQLKRVLQAVLPVLDTSAFSAAQNVTGNTLRLVSDRLTVIRDHGGTETGLSSGDVTEDLQMWGQVFGQKINQGTREGLAGFDAWTRGITVGLDTEVLGDATTAGVAFSYANTDVQSNSLNNTKSDIQSYNISLYGDYDLTDTSYLVGDLGYTYGDNETTRFNIGDVSGLNADSDYGSHQLEARLIAAQDYDIEKIDGVRITPKVQAHYIHYQAEDITEKGAGGAGLNVENEGLDILEFGVGIDVRKDHTLYNGGVLSPEITAGYRYDVIGDKLETTSTFVAGGPSFNSEGAEPDEHTLNLGLGIGYTAPNNVEFTASYDYERKDEYNSHSALLRLAAPF